MKNKKPIPHAYLITCRTYATWMHGDRRTSVDRYHNKYLAPKVKPNSILEKTRKDLCIESPFLMNAPQRETVLRSIIDTCQCANWYLYAAHVRANHMHVVVRAEKEPEKISVSLKAYATRYLKKQHPELNRERYWSKGESTRYIFQSESLFRAMQYTIEEQGIKMAFYCEPAYYEILAH
jgi:REP element-mobilizing transposase RayT